MRRTMHDLDYSWERDILDGPIFNPATSTFSCFSQILLQLSLGLRADSCGFILLEIYNQIQSSR